MEEETKPKIKCPMCGGEDFEPGKVQGHYTFKFKSEKCNLLEKATIFGGQTTRALCCKKCNFLAIFAETLDDQLPDYEIIDDQLPIIQLPDNGTPDDKICL